MIPCTVFIAAVLRLAAPSPGEDPAERSARLEGAGNGLCAAVAAEGNSGFVRRHGELALASITLASAETEGARFDLEIHSGRKLSPTFDRCFMGINPGNSHYSEDLSGVDPAASERCARAGVRSLVEAESYAHAKHFYKRWDKATVSIYASGHPSPFWRGARRRLRRSATIQTWLQ